KGRRIPCLSTLDILEELRGRGLLSENEWFAARHKLRVAGATIVPIVEAEVSHAVGRSHKAMSAEMRAIRASIDSARVSEIPSFPREILWFADTSLAVKAAIMPIWKSVSDAALAGRLSTMVINTIPNPEDWLSLWETDPPPGWVATLRKTILSALAVPVE